MDAYETHVENVSKIFYDQIKSADQKAAYVLTVALALTVTSEIARGAFVLETYATRSAFSATLAIMHVAAVMIATLSALFAIMPREGRAGSSLYWKSWPYAGERLLSARRSQQSEFIIAEYIEANRALSGICRLKFFWLRIAFYALLGSAVTHAALAAVSTQMSPSAITVTRSSTPSS